MPESKGRSEAGNKQPSGQRGKTGAKKQVQPAKQGRPTKKRSNVLLENRAWVPPTFITVGLLGVLWLIVYYLAGYMIPFMATLGPWNLVIGMGMMAASFAIATLWK